MLKGTLLYIVALYLLGTAVRWLYEDSYDRGFIAGQADGLAYKVTITPDDAPIHRES